MRVLEEVQVHWHAEDVAVELAQLSKDCESAVLPCIVEQRVPHAQRKRGAASAWGGDLEERGGEPLAVGGRRRVAGDIEAAHR